jgi:hypothetical protein
LGNALIGAGVVLVAVVNVLALLGAAFWAAAALSALAGVSAFYLLTSWSVRKEHAVYIGDGDPSAAPATLSGCKAAIEDYLRDHPSTPYFREKLTALSRRLQAFGARRDNIKDVIVERFGPAGLSYGKFSAPVAALQDYLVGLVNSLISRMRVFNEAEYDDRINEFTESKRDSDAEAYRAVEREYKDYTEQTLRAFDDATLKLDRLTLEISKLSESEVEKAMDIMHDLDAVIEDTKFYK